MKYGVCETYGKTSLLARLFRLLLNKKGWLMYSTILHPLDWTEV